MCCKKLPVVKFKLSDGAQLPKYESLGAACADLASIETKVVPADGAVVLRTGVKVEVPDGYVMKVYSRSGHGFKSGVRLANCVGIIDCDYRGEVMVKLTNDSGAPFLVAVGDRIAQFMIEPAPQFNFEVHEDLTSTERGEKGFGSTGA